jgi:hypothetical protein
MVVGGDSSGKPLQTVQHVSEAWGDNSERDSQEQVVTGLGFRGAPSGLSLRKVEEGGDEARLLPSQAWPSTAGFRVGWDPQVSPVVSTAALGV